MVVCVACLKVCFWGVFGVVVGCFLGVFDRLWGWVWARCGVVYVGLGA